MTQRFVGIGEMVVSDQQEEEIVTIGLGSCVAIVVTHAMARLAALAHVVLPTQAHPESKSRPRAYYADQGLDNLVATLRNYRNFHTQSCVTRIVGGATTGLGTGFQVGPRNVDAVQKGLSRHCMAIQASAVGGSLPRTVRVQVSSGRVWVAHPDGFEREL